MSENFDEILSAALFLPPDARAMLAEHLLDSLNGEDQKRIDALWADEIERRIREIDEGKVTLIPGDQVMDRLRSRSIVKKQKIAELEEQDAAGYARMPIQAGEFEEWESEQVWSEDEEGKPEETIPQTAATGGGTKPMDEALERAAEIRGKLEGRHHSDSTQIVGEDRQR